MAKLPKLTRGTKIILIFFAIFGAANVGYQAWAAIHQTEVIKQAEPHYLLLAVACQILVYIAFLPAFRAYFSAAGIDLSTNSSLRLIVSGIGLAKAIPLGEYLVWRRQLRHHDDGVGSVTRFMIVFYFFMILCLGALFVLSEGLVLLLYSDKLAPSFASKFIAVPIIITVIGVLIAGLTRVRPLRNYCNRIFSQHLGSPITAPWTILRNLKYGKTDVVILLVSLTLTLVVEATTLSLCLRAVGVEANFLLVLFGYTFTRVFTLVPLVPGSIGEVEAGTTFLFAAYGYAVSPVLTATILFRFLTFWLPIGIGAISYARLGHEHQLYWPLNAKLPHTKKNPV